MPAYKTVITVGDVNDKLDLGFTHIEVWASENEGGTYREVTAHGAQPAKFYSAPLSPSQVLALGGMTVGFRFSGETEQRITFDSVIQDWTQQQAVDRLNQVFPGRFSLMTLGGKNYLVATSPASGRSASITCTYSEVPLIFPSQVTVNGLDDRPQLRRDVFIYPYVDLNGASSTRYKWRFSSDGLEPISEFSARTMGTLERAGTLPVSIGTARFSGLDGQPVHRRLIISEESLPAFGTYVVGVGEPKIIESDDSGFLQVTLVQGASVRIAVEGSALVREIIVPSTDSFDIIAALAAAPDQFTVQTVPPLLTRRSF